MDLQAAVAARPVWTAGLCILPTIYPLTTLSNTMDEGLFSVNLQPIVWKCTTVAANLLHPQPDQCQDYDLSLDVEIDFKQRDMSSEVWF